MNSKLPLHPRLEPYRKEIEVTLKSVVRITATPGETKLWQSKFGGHPYLLANSPIENFDYKTRYEETPFPYPRNRKTGRELYMIGQINFEEIPHIELFPRKGLLQVFIDPLAKAYGMGYDQTAFRIIYYPEIIKDEQYLWQDFDGVRYEDEYRVWGYKNYSLTFELDHEPLSDSDYHFLTVYSKELQDLLRYDLEVRSSYLNLNYGLRDYNDGQAPVRHNKNKMGGYHYSQNGQDPREIYYDDEESILLIQFDGCDVFSWGDLGSACFFIDKKDLINLDFSNVIYHWDST